MDGVRDYMFSIIIENGVYDTYWTEKITDCFATGTVPIYWGTKKIPTVFDHEGIIWLNEGNEIEVFESLTQELYISKRKAIENNLKVVIALGSFAWKQLHAVCGFDYFPEPIKGEY
ncbi:MAG: hypothetical protein EBY04_04110 [Actinobacteria bacterium]|nr:hypothetical protein [Actinomycetota bacterium]